MRKLFIVMESLHFEEEEKKFDIRMMRLEISKLFLTYVFCNR